MVNISFAQTIQYEMLDDGVEHWYITNDHDKPWFFIQLENLFNIFAPNRSNLPFGQSVAFLIGVSEYKYISPQLPFVKNDLQDMRIFLLTKGGFDHIYVASETIVNRDLIEDYVRNKFSQWFQVEDRFLFYYSGHGADSGGKTGYMQFSEAHPGNFAGPQVLAINDVEDWSSEVRRDHMLFIFDCCASGLAFTTRAGNEGSYKKVIATLSKNGSRTVITAGTADEKTFEIRLPGENGNGVFTRAFLNAVETGKADQEKDGFMTIDEIMAQVKNEIASFSGSYGRSISPRMWELDPNNYRGAFVFLNPEARGLAIQLKDAYAEKIDIIPKRREEKPTANSNGFRGKLKNARIYFNIAKWEIAAQYYYEAASLVDMTKVNSSMLEAAKSDYEHGGFKDAAIKFNEIFANFE